MFTNDDPAFEPRGMILTKKDTAELRLELRPGECQVLFWYDYNNNDCRVWLDLETCDFLLAKLPGVVKTLQENTLQAKTRKASELRAEVEEKLKEIASIEQDLAK